MNFSRDPKAEFSRNASYKNSKERKASPTPEKQREKRGGQAKALKNNKTHSSKPKNLPQQIDGKGLASRSTTITKEKKGLGLEPSGHVGLDSKSESGSDPPQPDPEPDKFLIDEEWTPSSAAETRLKSRFVDELGSDGYARQVERFVLHHEGLGTEDTSDGFERSLENWLILANANRDVHSPINGTTVSGAGPPLSNDSERFVTKAAWLYQEMISKRRPSGRQPSVLELSNLKILARQIAGGRNVEFGLKRIGFWTADQLRSMVLDDDAHQENEREAAAG